MKVLLVDDELPIREWLTFCIEKMGISCIACANGRDALSAIEAEKPEIMLTDIRMPVMDGIELLREIQGRNLNVISVILTSHDDFEYARHAMALGAKEYLLKTELNQQTLAAAIERCGSHLRTSVNREEARAAFVPLVLSTASDPAGLSAKARWMHVRFDRPYLALAFYGVPWQELEASLAAEPEFADSELLPYERLFVILINMPMREPEAWPEQAADRLVTTCGGICGIGTKHIGLGELKSGILESFAALNDCYYSECSRMVGWRFGYGSCQQSRIDVYFQEVFNTISGVRLEDVNEKIDGLLNHLQDAKCSDWQYVGKLLVRTAHRIESVFELHIGETQMEAMKHLERRMEAATHFSAVCSAMRTYIRQIQSQLEGSGRHLSGYVKCAKQIIEEQYAGIQSLREIAEPIHISVEHLCRIFKSEMGVTCLDYLSKCRLQAAARLLEKSDLKIYEIAERTGYANAGHFSTNFKKAYGINPYKYREEKRRLE